MENDKGNSTREKQGGRLQQHMGNRKRQNFQGVSKEERRKNEMDKEQALCESRNDKYARRSSGR